MTFMYFIAATREGHCRRLIQRSVFALTVAPLPSRFCRREAVTEPALCRQAGNRRVQGPPGVPGDALLAPHALRHLLPGEVTGSEGRF